jgi:phage baseplate assembly protein W
MIKSRAFLSGLYATVNWMTGLVEHCSQHCHGVQKLSSILCTPFGQEITVTGLGCNLLDRGDTPTKTLVLFLAMAILVSSISLEVNGIL